MSADVRRTGSLTLDPAGEVNLQWTQAWRGLLMLRATDVMVRHPLHVHDYYSIGLVDCGEAEIQCRGESYRAVPGSVILIAPFEVHTEACVSPDGWSLRAIHPAPATMRRLLGLERTGVLNHLRFISPVVQDSALADQLDRMFRRSARASDGSIDEHTAEGVRAALKQQLCMTSHGGRMLRSQRAAEVVRAHIRDSRRTMASLAELSAITGMSRFHLSRAFRDATGLPPYAYFEQVRIARAKVLMRHGHEISAVAMALGFSDQSHFHRQFREASATTPGRYARALRSVFCPRQ
jgi:AraC-like DNA-binding protein